MSKRFFYTDPLAAAYMAKHHGMRFVDPESGQHLRIFKVAHFFIQHETDRKKYVRVQPVRYYLDPDSVGLLEPQVGDVVQFGDDHYGVFKEPDPQYRPNFSGISIILRNGIPFMSPERED